jgi:branched-chain amino acid transport system ATP-binding protein
LLLEVRNLDVSYGMVQALNNISLHVNEGEIVAMIGPNGAGKSTALKAICGLLKVTGGKITSGEVLFSGESIKNIPPHDLVKKGIALVPEGRRVFPSMTVLENLEMGGYAKKDKKGIKQSIEQICELFPVIRERSKQKAGTLSSGEQQMLSIGRALMLQPKLLLLDEPSLGLSPNYIEMVFEKLTDIRANGTTILLVEQNARMALEYADRGYVFKIGEIFLEDTSKNLLENDEIKKSFLGE